MIINNAWYKSRMKYVKNGKFEFLLFFFNQKKKKKRKHNTIFFVFTASVKAVQDLECIFIILLTQQLLEWLRMCNIDLV